MPFRTYYPDVVEVTAAQGLTADELTAWVAEHKGEPCPRTGVSNVMSEWTKLGAFRMEKFAVPHLITQGPKAGLMAGHAKYRYWPNMSKVWDPIIVTKAMGEKAAEPVLRERGIELVKAPPPAPRVAPAAVAPMRDYTDEPRFTQPPLQRPGPQLPPVLFGAEFRPDGVLITYEQFQRFAAMMHYVTDGQV